MEGEIHDNCDYYILSLTHSPTNRFLMWWRSYQIGSAITSLATSSRLRSIFTSEETQ